MSTGGAAPDRGRGSRPRRSRRGGRDPDGRGPAQERGRDRRASRAASSARCAGSLARPPASSPASPRACPPRATRRFSDPAWTSNPIFRRLGQEYLNLIESIDALLDDLELGRPQLAGGRAGPVRHEHRPSRPSLRRTSCRRTRPRSSAPSTPAARASSAARSTCWATCGTTVACRRRPTAPRSRSAPTSRRRPGWVVQRDDLAELIQYLPTTEKVRQKPILIIPPPIGRYYFLDLRPGRSFVEYAVSRGLQVFMISWRNPSRGHGRLGARRLRRSACCRRSTPSATSRTATRSARSASAPAGS